MNNIDNERDENSIDNSSSEKETISNTNITELLHDISMDLIIEIGRKKLKISELMCLGKGDIVELNQAVDDPIDIYANDKLIAKGNIITTNNKFCIKII